MARYIDADEALRVIRNSKQDCPYTSALKLIWNLAHDCCISCVDAVPIADVVEVKQIEIIRDDLKWWLETNTEKGVVHIPKYIVEYMIAKMEGKRRSKDG